MGQETKTKRGGGFGLIVTSTQNEGASPTGLIPDGAAAGGDGSGAGRSSLREPERLDVAPGLVGRRALPASGYRELVGVAMAQVVDPDFQTGLGDGPLEVFERRLKDRVVVVVDRDRSARLDYPDRLDALPGVHSDQDAKHLRPSQVQEGEVYLGVAAGDLPAAPVGGG